MSVLYVNIGVKRSVPDTRALINTQITIKCAGAAVPFNRKRRKIACTQPLLLQTPAVQQPIIW